MKFIITIYVILVSVGCSLNGKKTVLSNKASITPEDAKEFAAKAWKRDYGIDTNSYLIDVSTSADTNVWYVLGTLKTDYDDGYQLDENGDSVLILTNRSFVHALVGKQSGEVIRIYRTK